MARTIFPVLFVLALGTAALIWGMAGAGNIYGSSDPVDGLNSGSEIVDAKNDSAVGGGSYNGSAGGDSDGGGIVGLIISGVDAIVSFVSMVALLPWELMKLGLPEYFALPIGFLAQGLVGIGVIEFATNRELT